MLEHEGPDLERIHSKNNDKKFFCHFTGFLEGIAASGYVETEEIAPLIAECEEFVARVSDGDANDVIQDFDADLLCYQSIFDVVEIRVKAIDPSCDKSSLNRFLGFCRGIACDGKITTAEAERLINIVESQPDLLETIGVKQVLVSCIDAIEDGIVSPEESFEISDAIGHIVGDCYGDTGLTQTDGVANIHEHNIDDLLAEIDGQTVVLTGKFKTSPRSELEEELRSQGALVVKHVSRKTDFIVVGGTASRDWIELNRGTKIRKAQELRLQSEKPKFLSESQLLRHLRLC